MKWIILALTLLLSFSIVTAESGFEMLEVPDGSISKINTRIEAKIENWGYNKIFIALPSGWTPEASGTFAQSYAVREFGLWRIYGLPYDKQSLLGRGEVFTGRGAAEAGNPIKHVIKIGDRYGWWLKPNEGAIIKVTVNDIGGSGTIDPQKIEKENPSIKVVRWYQEFTLELSSPGFITAPWVVEGAALIEASPAPYSSELGKEKLYYEDYKKETDLEVPDWDEWFTFRNSLAPIFSKRSVVPVEMKYLSSIEEAEPQLTPVWKVDKVKDIIYAYEWKRSEKVKGITFWRDKIILEGIPEWFAWF